MAYYVVDNNGNKIEGPFEDRRSAADKANEIRQRNLDNPRTAKIIETEQDDETTDDSQNTMSYNFIANDDEAKAETNDFDTVGSMWTLGDHSSASSDERSTLSRVIEETMADMDDDIDGDMKAVLEDASDLVKDTRVSKFECPVEACGLGHSHADHKHDVREAFAVLGKFTEEMNFCPYCHCGVNELSMLMAFYPYISEDVFGDRHIFDDAMEVEPDILEAMYRLHVEEDASVNRAAAMIANRRGIDEAEAIPLGTRESLKEFFQRRRRIDRAANAAPIAQETRNKIEEAREELEQLTS